MNAALKFFLCIGFFTHIFSMRDPSQTFATRIIGQANRLSQTQPDSDFMMSFFKIIDRNPLTEQDKKYLLIPDKDSYLKDTGCLVEDEKVIDWSKVIDDLQSTYSSREDFRQDCIMSMRYCTFISHIS